MKDTYTCMCLLAEVLGSFSLTFEGWSVDMVLDSRFGDLTRMWQDLL